MTDVAASAGPPVVAVDLGGTKLRGAVVSPAGEILHREVVPTPHDDPEPTALGDLLSRLAASSGATSAVVGVPGRVDYHEGALEWAPNLPDQWVPHLTDERLEDRSGMPVSLANDADMAAVGEAAFGAGRGYDDVVFVTLSTGVGAGVVLGGRLVRGRRSMAEAGHTIIDAGAAAEGRPASFEDLASGTALGRLAAERAVGVEGPDVLAAANGGNAAAREVWDAVVGAAGIGFANLAQLFSPQVIVVGGGFGLTGEPVLDPIRRGIERWGPPRLREPIVVVNAALGDDAGLIGAAAWSRMTGGAG